MQREACFLTGRELAALLKVSPETVREWSRQGAIPVVRLSPKALRYNLDAVLAAIASPAKGAANG